MIDFEGKFIPDDKVRNFGKCPFCGGDLIGHDTDNYGVCQNCGAV